MIIIVYVWVFQSFIPCIYCFTYKSELVSGFSKNENPETKSKHKKVVIMGMLQDI